MKVNHTGFVVADMDEAVKALVGLGFHVTVEPFFVSYGDVQKAFMENELGEGIELLCPVNEESNMMKTLRERPGAFHICVETPNIEKTIEELTPLGYQATVVRFAKGFGSRACFMEHPILGTVQFVEILPDADTPPEVVQ